MTASPRVLVLGQQMPWLIAELSARFRIHQLQSEEDPQAFLAAHGADFSGLVSAPRPP